MESQAARTSVGERDERARRSELETGRALRTLQGHAGQVNAVAVTPDGRYAVSASAHQTLKVCELQSGRALRALQGHAALVNSVAVTPDGRLAVSASADQTVKVWELESGSTIATFSC